MKEVIRTLADQHLMLFFMKSLSEFTFSIQKRNEYRQ